jgi:hypothetical protein
MWRGATWCPSSTSADVTLASHRPRRRPAGTASARLIVHDAPLTPALQRPGAARPGLAHLAWASIGNTLFWMVVALAVLTLWMLLGTGRHMRRRSQIQNALLKETQLPPRHGELHASPACGRWTWKAASPTSTPPSAR